MIGKWIRAGRRRRLLAKPPPREWLEWLPTAVLWYAGWSSEYREKLVANMRIFIAEKYWEGCDGLVVTNEMKFMIAAQACMMLTGVEGYCFEGVKTILVYPQQFRRKANDGLLEWHEWRSGEAWERGPIVLAWGDLVDGLDYGHNLVVHEFAHHVDGLNGSMSGRPWFKDRETERDWERVSREEMQLLREQTNLGVDTLLDPYGSTNRAEFFAVSSETFFELPKELRQHHPRLYDILSKVYGIDPAGWT